VNTILQFSTPDASTPLNLEVIKSRFLDHLTILFMLLGTWESIVIEVIIN